MPLHHPGTRHAMGTGLKDFQIGNHRVPNAFDLTQPFLGCRQHTIEITKRIHQRARQRFHILTRDGSEQSKFQQFIIRHRC